MLQKCIRKTEIKSVNYENYSNASKIENEIRILKDDNYNVDKMEEKYGKFLFENEILQKWNQRFESD